MARRILVLLALLAAPAWPAPGAADPLTPFQPGGNRVDLADVLPHRDRPENRRNEFYSEWWSFVFRLDDGYTAYVQFLASNTGPGDGKAKVRASLQLPDGRKLSARTDLDADAWSFAPDRFELRFGDNVVSGPLEALQLALRHEKFDADLRIRSIAAPWKPGNGLARYGAGKDRYYAFHYIVPVGRVEGTVRIPGEEAPRTIRGLVHVDHSVASIGMHQQARRVARFRALDEKVTFLATDITTPDEYGGRPLRFAVLFEDGKPVLETVDFQVREAEPWQDEKKSGYAVPRLLELSGEAPGGSFRGAVKATRMTGREDYLESSGAVASFVIARFAKPMMYYHDAFFALEVRRGLDTRTFKGQGTYYFTVVNP